MRRNIGAHHDGDTAIWMCRVCGCVDEDCANCIRRTGSPCSWVEPGLCSACAHPTNGSLVLELNPKAVDYLEVLAERGLYGIGTKGVAEGLVYSQLRAVVPMHTVLDAPKKQRWRKS